MNEKISLNRNTIRILYFKNKEFILPSMVIFICLLLFLKVLIPQFREVFLMFDQEKVLQEKLSIMKNNYSFIASLDNLNLDSQVKVVSSALPLEKDYVGIVNAISQTAARANVSVEDFGFEVGDLSTESAVLAKSRPSIKINLALKGGLENTKQFLKNLSEQFPLSEVSSVQINEQASNVSTDFYYRSFASIRFKEDMPIGKLSNEKKTLLDKLSSWSGKNPAGSDFLFDSSYAPAVSESAKDKTSGPF